MSVATSSAAMQGGTNCSVSMRMLLKKICLADLVVYWYCLLIWNDVIFF